MNPEHLEEYHELTERERMMRRAQRTKLRKERQRRQRIRRLMVAVPVLLAAALIVVFFAVRAKRPKTQIAAQPEQPAIEEPVKETYVPLALHSGGSVKTPDDAVTSTYAVLIDAESGEILVSRGGSAVINPASMTKILTVLTAADYITDIHDTIVFTQEMSDYAYLGGMSIAGYLPDEVVTVEDLLYGTILPSGADAAMGLAVYVSGSEESFVNLMNEKAAALGLSSSAHFTNCSGAYNENHHCTCEDMAIILKAAMDNELCREVLSAHTYTSSLTAQHPEGIPLSNWFLRRIEDKDTGDITVVGAKTGYVQEAGSCAASYGEDSSGHGYLCVTGDADSAWLCIYDHVALYRDYIT